MKKIILEEVDRIREIMGFNSLITEGVGDEILGAIGKLVSDTKGRSVVDDFVKNLKQADGVSKYLDDTGKPIESWFELNIYVGKNPGKTVDDIIPNFTDELFDFFLFKSSPENAQMFRKAATDAVFPSELLDDFPVWKSGTMTPQSAKEFTDDMKAIADGVGDPYIKNAVENTGIMQQIRGTASRDADMLLPNTPAQLSQEVNSLKQNSLKKDYKYTERDWEILNMAKNNGELSAEEFAKISSRRVPKFGEMMKLYDNYKLAAKSGRKNAPLSFEEYLISLLKYKIPSKFTRTNVDVIKRITNPFLASLGLSKTMSPFKGFMWLTGVPTFGYIATLLYHAVNIGGGVASEVTDAAGDVDYAVNAGRRWKEFWEKGNNAAMKNLGGGNESIYSGPDTYVNLTYAEGTPDIEVINSDENIVRVLGGKISLGGELYDKVYFRLGFEIAGNNVGRMSPDVIQPIEASPADAGAGTQQQQQTTTVSPITDAEKAKVVEKLKVMDTNGDYGNEDYNYIKKIDDTTFEYTDIKNKKIEVKI